MSPRPNASASGRMLSAVAPRPCTRIIAATALSKGAPEATVASTRCGPAIAVVQPSAAPERGEEGRVGIGIRRQAELDLHLLDGRPRLHPKRAVDASDVEAARLQALLHVLDLVAGERLRAAFLHRRSAREPRGKIRRRRRIDERTVPLR